MTKAELKALVDKARENYMAIQRRQWDGQRYGMIDSEMWREASQIAPEEWREIVRVLAQGGDLRGGVACLLLLSSAVST